MAGNRGPVALVRARAWKARAAESLFLVPATMVVAAAGLGVAIDTLSVGVPADDLPAGLVIGPNAAATLLSTIAGATITTVGVVFSIVVLSVQLASGQFSPRIVGNFFRDRRSQLTVGVLAATFTYSVLALFSVNRSSNGHRAVPIVAVGVAAVLGVASILSIVAFLNHSARRLYVGNLIERVTTETLELLDRLAERRGDERAVTGDEAVLADQVPPDALVVDAPSDGWVQQVSHEALIDALPDGSVVRLETRAGAYVVAGTPIARLWPAPAEDDQAELVRTVQAAFAIGQSRTLQQDVDFGLRQLSDIALRALSPSVNDPHTAVEVVARHAAILRRMVSTDFPPRVRKEHGVVVLRPHDLRFDDYVDDAFDDVRRVAAPHPVVARALIRTCTMLCAVAEAEGRRDRLSAPRRQIRLTLEGVKQAGLVPDDVAALQRLAGDAGRG